MALFRRPANFSRIVRPVFPFPFPITLPNSEKKPEYFLDLPFDKLSIFARRYETAQILSGLPIFVVAELAQYEALVVTPPPPPNDDQGQVGDGEDIDFGDPIFPPADPPRLRRLAFSTAQSKRVHVPLGMLSTDHVGYASFDLTVLRAEAVVNALRQAGALPSENNNGVESGDGSPALAEPPTIGVKHLWVLPFGDLNLCVDAIANGDIGPDFLTLRLHMDEQRLSTKELYENTIPSMQSPGILDYRMSPGSFTVSPSMLVGTEAACASLLPSNLATQAFRFFQVARIPGKILRSDGVPITPQGPLASTERFRLGYIFTYTTEWFPIGHSLGTLSYSLPLAPGEMVKVAVVDWSRSDVADRSEDTGFSENLQHRQLRDRSLSENVTAMLDEWQRGGSVMGGVAASGSANMGTYSVGGAASLGGAYTTSSGTRDLTADTAQQVADAFHQSTSAMRELRSTVVVQDSQAETSKAQTRIVANYNHGHALTVLYYEVLRHYRVVTRVTNAKLALLIDYSNRLPKLQTDSYLISHRADLEALLMDQSLKPSFDAVSRTAAGTARYNDAKTRWDAEVQPGEALITSLKFTVTTSEEGAGGTNADIRMKLQLFENGEQLQVSMAVPNGHDDATILDVEGTNIFEGGPEPDILSIRTPRAFKWSELRSFIISHEGGGRAWRPAHFKLVGSTQRADEIVLHDAPYGRDIKEGEIAPEFLTIQPPPKSAQPVKDNFVNPADAEAVQRLKDHYENHQYDYSRAILLKENANARAVKLDAINIGGHSVLDLIENKAMEMTGNWMAFPVPSGTGKDSPAQFLKNRADVQGSDADDHLEDAYVEQLLSLPTRGVFAEAKLGSCNSNEKIDNERFWDWQKSPIPHMAPDIAPASLDSRDRAPTGLTPSAFPQSVVNIQQPQALPDPTGLSAAIKAIATPDIFRDMSASKEVGSLLEKLSDNATKMASESMKQGSKDQLLKNIREAPELSKEQKAKLVNDLFASEVKATKDADKPAVKPKPGSGPKTNNGEGSTGDGSTPDSSKPDKDESQTHDGGSEETTKDKDKTPKTPAPSKPAPKPAKPAPTPTKGLQFKLIFHGVKSEQELSSGLADIDIQPNSKGVLPDDSQNVYVPGKTIGPPAPVAANLKSRHWQDLRIDMNSIMLDTETINSSGDIRIGVQCEQEVMDTDSRYAIIRKHFDAFNPLAKPVFDIGFLQFNNSISYDLPAQGNIVVLDIRPEVIDVPVTIGESDDVEETLGAKIALEWKIISGEATGERKDAQGKTTSVTMNYRVTTGGLIVKQLK